ncbi:MAG: RodZ domain-containing protein [Nitrospinaceae bacterium]
MSEDFGSYLKHERELRGIPLDEIALNTKISIRFLQALEENRFEDLPGEVFVRGFIRSYGQAIGSNTEELLAAYHEATGKREDSETPPSPELEAGEGFPKSLDNPVLKMAFGFGAVLLLIIGGVYWVTSQGDSTPEQDRETRLAAPTTTAVDNSLPEAASEPDAEPEGDSGPRPEGGTPAPGPAAGETSDSQIPATPAGKTPEAGTPDKNTVTVSEKNDIIKDLQDQTVPKSDDPSTQTALADQSLRLVIRVTENAWFNLTVDGQRDQDFILPVGGSKTIEAKNAIVMTIGNRRATQLTLNNQPLELPESPDNVIRNLTVNAEQLN